MAQEIGLLGLRIPILVTTAFEQPDYLIRCIDLGVEKYIVKPVDVDRLEVALLDTAHRLRAEAHLARRLHVAADLRRHQALSLLAGGIAHDYQNLLQVLLFNVTEALRRAQPESEVHELLMEATACAAEASRLADLLGQVSGDGLFQAEPVQLEALVREAIGEVILGTGVSHELVCADLLPPGVSVLGDRRYLGALLAHLATNAVEAMPSGGSITTWLSLASAAALEEVNLPPGAYAHLAVQDRGEGISPGHLGRIFDPYFSTRKRGPGHGIGLGLTLCRSIAEKHRARITAESTPGQGTTVHLFLPLAPARGK